MALVTGNLSDFGGSPMSDLAPRIIFIPSGPAVSPDIGILASRKQIAIPDAAGDFTVQLFENEFLRPETWYSVVIEWLNGEGVPIGRDDVEGRLLVPEGGGAIGALMRTPWNPTLAWWGPDEPAGIPVANTLWLDPDTGILSIRSN